MTVVHNDMLTREHSEICMLTGLRFTCCFCASLLSLFFSILCFFGV